MDRKTLALKHINLHAGKGLELGPLYNPLVLKSEATIFYLDHLSTEGLRQKYGADGGVPVEQIVAIDYVLDKTLQNTCKTQKFDYIIACHVIEHIPDMVRWLADIATVLKPDGLLSLVIPDKRFTFDMFRNESRPADIMGAYLEKATRVSAVAMYDDVHEYRDAIDPAKAWADPASYMAQKHAEQAHDKALSRSKKIVSGEYVDCHCHVLTPASFFEILRSLIHHNLFDFEVVGFDDTPQNQLEFYVTLKKSTKNSKAKMATVPTIPAPKRSRELEVENDVLKQELIMLKQSKSWRITRPLRFISNVVSTYLK